MRSPYCQCLCRSVVLASKVTLCFESRDAERRQNTASNSWVRHFLCGPCPTKGKQVIVLPESLVLFKAMFQIMDSISALRYEAYANEPN
jgi:hypothetical protein